MLYFESIPKILTPDVNGDGIILTNLMTRSEIIPSLLNNPMIFYKYDIQDGDTPEIIADKYYGDSYRYWVVLYANQIMDPQWNWPLTNQQFDAYLINKYSSISNLPNVLSYTQATLKEYRKTIKSIDSISLVDVNNNYWGTSLTSLEQSSTTYINKDIDNILYDSIGDPITITDPVASQVKLIFTIINSFGVQQTITVPITTQI